jgi:multicomponent Na+:H+ antiporter subunit G
VIALVLLAAGLTLLFLGGLGLVRFDGPYERLQAAGVGDIGGAALFLIGLLVRDWTSSGGVGILLLMFLLFTGPIATHAVAKGAFVRGVRQKGGEE